MLETSDGRTSAPSLVRRFSAILYDCLLLIALLIIASFPVVLLAGGPPTNTVARVAYQLYLLAVIFLFFGWFWIHGGQTLGMRAWRLKVVGADGEAISWKQASLRFFSALISWAGLGLGFLWSLGDRDRLTWHDRLSGTHLVLLPKHR